MVKYLIRLDDACPGMNKSKWNQIEVILDKYNIKPLVGIIPNNLDQTIEFDGKDEQFWVKARKWQDKKWAIAMHGYNHLCSSNSGGINPFYNRSEFAGLQLSEQEEKITAGLDIFLKENLNPMYFFAPSHTFDLNTILALKNKTEIKIISDTIAFNPYKLNNFLFVPQQLGNLREIKIPGVWTFCLHPNNISDSEFDKIEIFIKNNISKFTNFDSINLANLSNPKVHDWLLKKGFFIFRKLFRN